MPTKITQNDILNRQIASATFIKAYKFIPEYSGFVGSLESYIRIGAEICRIWETEGKAGQALDVLIQQWQQFRGDSRVDKIAYLTRTDLTKPVVSKLEPLPALTSESIRGLLSEIDRLSGITAYGNFYKDSFGTSFHAYSDARFMTQFNTARDIGIRNYLTVVLQGGFLFYKQLEIEFKETILVDAISGTHSEMGHLVLLERLKQI